MAFSLSDIVEIQLVGLTSAGEFRNVWHYILSTLPSPTVSAANLGEAWWNAVKPGYRNATAVGFGPVFKTVKVRSMMSATGDAGDYAIPSADQTGVRTTPSGDQCARFMACGLRLVVGSRLTRHGHKRIFGLYEADVSGDGVQAAFADLALGIAQQQLPSMVLGAPALTQTLIPVVAAFDGTYPVTRFQPWTSVLVDTNVTTQLTRKIGRGA